MAIYKDNLAEVAKLIDESWTRNKQLPSILASVKTKFGPKYLVDFTETAIPPEIEGQANILSTSINFISSQGQLPILSLSEAPALLDFHAAIFRVHFIAKMLVDKIDEAHTYLKNDIESIRLTENQRRSDLFTSRLVQYVATLKSEPFLASMYETRSTPNNPNPKSNNSAALDSARELLSKIISEAITASREEMQEELADNYLEEFFQLKRQAKDIYDRGDAGSLRKFLKKQLLPCAAAAISVSDRQGTEIRAKAELVKVQEWIKKLEAEPRWWQFWLKPAAKTPTTSNRESLASATMECEELVLIFSGANSVEEIRSAFLKASNVVTTGPKSHQFVSLCKSIAAKGDQGFTAEQIVSLRDQILTRAKATIASMQ